MGGVEAAAQSRRARGDRTGKVPALVPPLFLGPRPTAPGSAGTQAGTASLGISPEQTRVENEQQEGYGGFQGRLCCSCI